MGSYIPLETTQVNITVQPTTSSVRTYMPDQQNTAISDSYNATMRNNLGSHNRNVGRRQQGVETNERGPRPLPSWKSDGDQREPPSWAEHEVIGKSSSAPPGFAQPHLPHSYSRSNEPYKVQATDQPRRSNYASHNSYDDQRQPFLLNQQSPDDTPAVSRNRIPDSYYPAFQESKPSRPWPVQTGTRDVTRRFDPLQDSNRPPPPNDYHEYDTPTPQSRFDGGTSVPHPREVRSRHTPHWSSDYTAGDRHGTYDDQRWPFLSTQHDRDDSPASHHIPDSHYPEKYYGTQWPGPRQTGTRDVTGHFDHLPDSNRPHYYYDTPAPQPRSHQREVRPRRPPSPPDYYEYTPTPQPRPDQRELRPREPKGRRIPSDWDPDYTVGDKNGTYDDQRRPFLSTQHDRDDTPTSHLIPDSRYSERYHPAFQEPKPSRQWHAPSQTVTDRPPSHYDTPATREPSRHIPSDWPPDDRPGPHSTYDDQRQPFLSNQRDNHHGSDKPASSRRHPNSQRYNPAFHEPRASGQWPSSQTGTRDGFDDIQDSNRPPSPHDYYDTPVPQPRFDRGTSVPHPREVRRTPSDYYAFRDRHDEEFWD